MPRTSLPPSQAPLRRRLIWLPDVIWGQVIGEAEARRSALGKNAVGQIITDALTLYFRMKERHES